MLDPDIDAAPALALLHHARRRSVQPLDGGASCNWSGWASAPVSPAGSLLEVRSAARETWAAGPVGTERRHPARDRDVRRQRRAQHGRAVQRRPLLRAARRARRSPAPRRCRSTTESGSTRRSPSSSGSGTPASWRSCRASATRRRPLPLQLDGDLDGGIGRDPRRDGSGAGSTATCPAAPTCTPRRRSAPACRCTCSASSAGRRPCRRDVPASAPAPTPRTCGCTTRSGRSPRRPARGPWHDALVGQRSSTSSTWRRALALSRRRDSADERDRAARDRGPHDQRQPRLPRARRRLGRLRQPRQPADDAHRADAGVERRGRAVLRHARPAWASRVTVMTFSEFGRTSWDNDGQGTDHGTADCAFVLGANVKGGTVRPAADAGRARPLGADVGYTSTSARTTRSILDGWLGGGAIRGARRQLREPRAVRLRARDRARRRHRQRWRRRCVDAAGCFVPVSPVAAGRHARRHGWRPGPPARSVRVAAPSRSPARRRSRRRGDGGGRQRDGGRRHGTDLLHRLPGWHGAARDVEPQPEPGRAMPNLVVMGVGADGTIEVFNSVGDDALPRRRVRLLHGRRRRSVHAARAEPPVRHAQRRRARRPVRSHAARIDVEVAGHGGVPPDVSAVVLNLTVDQPSRTGSCRSVPPARRSRRRRTSTSAPG